MDAHLTTFSARASDLPAMVAALLSDPPPGTARIVRTHDYDWHSLQWGEPSDPRSHPEATILAMLRALA